MCSRISMSGRVRLSVPWSVHPSVSPSVRPFSIEIHQAETNMMDTYAKIDINWLLQGHQPHLPDNTKTQFENAPIYRAGNGLRL